MSIRNKYLILFSVVYYIALLFLYPNVLELFNYMWKIDYEFDNTNFIISIISIIVISFFINFKSFGFSLISGLFYFLFIPAMSVATIADYGNSFLLIICSTILTLLLLYFSSKYDIKIKPIVFSSKIKRSVNIIIIALLVLLLFSNTSNFNPIVLLSDVYTFREDNIQSGFLSYILFWIQSVFVFWILIKAFFDNDKIKFSYLILALFLGYLSFMVTGLKTVLFSPIFTTIVFIFLKYSRYKFFGFVLTYIFFLLGLGFLFPNLIILAVIDRIFYLPSLLNLRYIEYFTNNPLYFFKGSKLEIFVPNKSNYTDIPGHLIDAAYGGGGMNANTGAFGSIYSDLGIIGLIIVFPLFICMLDIIIKSISKDMYVNSLLGLYYSFVIVNAPPTDIILTHGLIIHLVILYARNKYIKL